MERKLNRLRVVLAEQDKTNKWLAEQIGCSPTTVSKWCTNYSQPPLEALIKMSQVLKVSLEDLVWMPYNRKEI